MKQYVHSFLTRSHQPVEYRYSFYRPGVLFLWRDDCFLTSLSNTHLHYGLGRDLDLLAGSRIETHTLLSLGEDEFADAWNGKASCLLGLGDRKGCHLVNDLGSVLLGKLELIRKVSHDLRLGERFLGCHILSSFFE